MPKYSVVNLSMNIGGMQTEVVNGVKKKKKPACKPGGTSQCSGTTGSCTKGGASTCLTRSARGCPKNGPGTCQTSSDVIDVPAAGAISSMVVDSKRLKELQAELVKVVERFALEDKKLDP